MTPEISYLLVASVRYTLMVLLSANIVGNSFVVIIFLKSKSTRQFSDLLLFNLATADLLFGTVVLICSLAFHFAGTTINDLYCKITGGVVYLSCGVSVFTLAAIAMERYGAVVKPVRARVRMRDSTRNHKIVQITWIIALIFVSPIVVFLKKIDVAENIVDCGFLQNEGMAEFGRIYDAVVVLVLFLVPNCFMCCVYGRLVFKLWWDNQAHPKPRLALMNSRDKLTKVSFVITIVFTICWTPYYLRTLLTLVLGRHFLVLSLVVCRILVVVNSCANPIIYTLQCARFRRHLRRLLDCRNKISP
ncbi:allatostatin-A receptor-like [Oculina patagonica]